MKYKTEAELIREIQYQTFNLKVRQKKDGLSLLEYCEVAPSCVMMVNLESFECNYFNQMALEILHREKEQIEGTLMPVFADKFLNFIEFINYFSNIGESFFAQRLTDVHATFHELNYGNGRTKDWFFSSGAFVNKNDDQYGSENDFLIFSTPVKHMGEMSHKISGVLSENTYMRKNLEKFARLTNREKEIITCIVAGFTNPQIADKLFISKHTVAQHRKNIFKKLDLSNNSFLELYKFADTFDLIG